MKREVVNLLAFGVAALLPFAQAKSIIDKTPFADAAAVWHMADATDSVRMDRVLKIEGEVKLGVELKGAEREASLARGGDGKVAELAGGWLTAGNGIGQSLNLTGDALTICLRLRDPSGKWAAGLLSKKIEAKNYNLFAWDLGRGMEFGFELNLREGGQFKQVRTPLAGLSFDGWHDLVVRYDGARLELFIDGVSRDQTPASGQVAGVPEAGFLIGADPGGKNTFHGLVDHAALWNRALTDAEIEFICGGREAVKQAGTLEQSARQERERQAREEGARQDQQAEAKLNEARQRVAADPHYPRYHLAPPVGWMNDPHPIYFKGAYHMFYQYSFLPDDPYGGPHRWGHAVSKDLVHWKHLPPGITPRDHGIAPDHHIWSGCLVDNKGVGTAIYTIENIDIWASTSTDDDLREFKKYEANPIIKGPPPEPGILNEMRDPWVWKEPDGWYLVVGSGLQGGKGSVLPLYKSSDLVHWRYLHPLFQGDPSKGDGAFSECPFFFPLGDRYVLAVSEGAAWMTGTFKDQRFQPEKRGRLGYGRFYVPQTVLDGKGRRILWAWGTEGRDREAQKRAGWASMQTLPRVVSLAEDKTLRFDPAPELETLRTEHHREKDLTVGSTPIPIQNSRGMQAELQVVLTPGSAHRCGLILQDKAELTRITYDAGAKTLRCQDKRAPFALAPGEDLTLRVFLDRSVVEIYANRTAFLVDRIYPQDIATVEAGLFAEGGEVKVKQVDAWQMKSIW